MRNKTIREAYTVASSFLRDHRLPDPTFDAELMLRELLDVDRATFFLKWDDLLTDEQQMKWTAWLSRRGNHEPLQYIFGHAPFYGRTFQVTPSVLIPRPETEGLVEHVLSDADEIFGDCSLNVVEVGTGSGCIAITLQLERPHWQVTTIDISAAALQIAKQNAHVHEVADKIRFLEGSFLEPVANEVIDIIISNPPYIPSAAISGLDSEVEAYEPHLALDGGVDGLYPYVVITRQIAKLKAMEKRLIAFEIGDDQGQQVAEFVRAIPSCVQVEVWKDIADRDRYVLGFLG